MAIAGKNLEFSRSTSMSYIFIKLIFKNLLRLSQFRILINVVTIYMADNLQLRVSTYTEEEKGNPFLLFTF